MIVPVIQARLNSTRFPGKVLADFRGRTVLGYAVACARKAFPGTEVVLAIPAGSDRRLTQWCDVLRCNVVEGPEEDVLSRYMYVVAKLGLADSDIIVRITPDDPLKLSLLVWLATRLVELGAPYADTNHGMVTGFGAEAFTVAALRDADKLDLNPSDREHVTPGMRRRHPPGHLRASIDTAADIVRLEELMVGAPP